MFARFGLPSLALTLVLGNALGLDLDTNSQDSIKSVASSLADTIIATYNSAQKKDPIPGLFGKPYFFWQDGATWGGLIDYAHLTGDNQYNELISSAVLHQIGEYNAFMPKNQTKAMGNDDQSFWALMAMTAAETGLEMPQKDLGGWADLAANVFDIQVERWDEQTCGGGLKWQIYTFNRGYNYKNSMSNGNFFLLAARLAKFTGNATYSEWAEKTLSWARDVGFVSEDFDVFDGADDTTNCSSINKIQWSLNAATFTEGAALMYNLTNGNDSWRDAVSGFVNASAIFQDDSSILSERACEKSGRCTTDQRALKGVAIRSFARAAQAAPFASEALQKMIQATAAGAAKNCDGDDDKVKCGFKWTGSGEGDDGEGANLGEVNNALQAVQGLLWPQAEALASSNGTGTTSPSGSPAGSPMASPAGSGAPQNTDASGAAGALVTPYALLLSAAVLAMLCL